MVFNEDDSNADYYDKIRLMNGSSRDVESSGCVRFQDTLDYSTIFLQ